MHDIQLPQQALADLNEIAAYLKPVSLQSALNVRGAILKSFHLLREFPRAGRPQTRPGVRKRVSTRYT